MAYVTVPKDLDKIKNKVVFGLTFRQIVCLGIAGATGLPAYFAAKEVMGASNAALVMVAVMLPAFLFALYEKDGLPLERVLYNIIRVRWIRPGKRKRAILKKKEKPMEEKKTEIGRVQERPDEAGITEETGDIEELDLTEAEIESRERIHAAMVCLDEPEKDRVFEEKRVEQAETVYVSELEFIKNQAPILVRPQRPSIHFAPSNKEESYLDGLLASALRLTQEESNQGQTETAGLTEADLQEEPKEEKTESSEGGESREDISEYLEKADDLGAGDNPISGDGEGRDLPDPQPPVLEDFAVL